MNDLGDRPSDAKRVLVVDDWLDSAEMLATFLMTQGHEAHVAVDGRSALDRAERLRPDVAILDIGLPDLDGCAVARELRKARPDIVLIALTGYGGDRDRVDFVRAGFDAHVVKPVELRVIAALVSATTRAR